MAFSAGKAVVGALLLLGLAQLAQGSWIYFKAELAQRLLQHAWERGVQTGRAGKPWPWADTSPILRLRLPRLGIDTIVLQGDHGQALAFGPGHSEASVLPGSPGIALISGHRDTHFSFMRDVQVGDRLQIELIDGELLDYRVKQLAVVSADKVQIDAGAGEHLLLATCWPFDSPIPGGPSRLVAVTEPAPAPDNEVDSGINQTPPLLTNRKTDDAIQFTL